MLMVNPIKLDVTTVKKLIISLKIAPLKLFKNNQPPNTLPQPKQTYAQTITSTPKRPQPPILHPSTKVKLVKQNIKKSTHNFPPSAKTPLPKRKKKKN